ncbi:fumarylacetoacetate hydrolase family protein [Nocardioides albus]|uniref:2-keto-4-pentenoate hydratase/2-oxohepta-3-ene-1,7-dioic acid hydratase in catechol pathway n=1 Tax=Nocardioides albus TaxID=1841 RepID=A0A7W5F8I7_9ACTN|nr:fumarylacetoacetate hydrolase family protein [Nocardioides albus]MBB3089245.1 2-keto-4-pentenoate hydratase/2-oxohepta-3-ene-1,7-dioic acid hydratase in catechol pathway [Nocardioides albus]GGU13274.1 hydroxylase [Nocardioides albus]
MKLATYLDTDLGVPRVGLVTDDGLYPFAVRHSMRSLIEAGRDVLDRAADHARAAEPLDLAEVELMAPIEPASVRDFVAFEEHVEGVRRSVDGVSGVPDAWYEAPAFYFTNPHAILGPGAEVPFPAACEARDFELEVAVVVGAEARSVSAQEAETYVFGYTIMNDWSARDLQGREMQVGLGPAKGKDFATTLGPWIVTADELDPYRDEDGFLDLLCTVSVNGVEVGRDRLSNVGWTFETMIAYASRDSRVVAGDVLGSGTVGNGGCLAELWGRRDAQDPPPLQPGDVVTLEVEGIGTLTNTVGVAPPAPDLPPVRRRAPAARLR